MKSNWHYVALSALITLTGCVSALEQCLQNANSDLSGMLILKEETELNIFRGYAVHRQSVPYQYTGSCYDYYLGSYSCQQTGYRTQETPISIDVDGERRKLAQINAAIPAMRRGAETKSAQYLSAMKPMGTL